MHDANEWSERMTDDANWVNQNFNNFGAQVSSAVVFGHAFPGGKREQFGDAFVTASQNFGKPVLYMMGDRHSWELNNPFPEAPNIPRVTVDSGVPSVRVTITHDAAQPFLFDRSPLVVQSSSAPASPSPAPLEPDQLTPLVVEAASRLTPFDRSVLDQLEYRVVDLPGDLLGRVMGSMMQIDINAAGFGWYIDATPDDDSEFIYDATKDEHVADLGGAAIERVDLLTAVMHEMGHVLGLEHSHSTTHRVMEFTLPLDTRRLPLEACYALTELWREQ